MARGYPVRDTETGRVVYVGYCIRTDEEWVTDENDVFIARIPSKEFWECGRYERL